MVILYSKKEAITQGMKAIVLHYLREEAAGKANAKKSPVLQELFNLTGSELRVIINTLRSNGFAICSGSRGYFYANSVTETADTIRQMRSRVAVIQAAIAGMESNVF